MANSAPKAAICSSYDRDAEGTAKFARVRGCPAGRTPQRSRAQGGSPEIVNQVDELPDEYGVYLSGERR